MFSSQISGFVLISQMKSREILLIPQLSKSNLRLNEKKNTIALISGYSSNRHLVKYSVLVESNVIEKSQKPKLKVTTVLIQSESK